MRIGHFFIPMILASITFSVGAEEIGRPIEQALDDCQNRAQTTLDSLNCYQVATAAWDAELNNQYQALLRDQPENVRRVLRHAQHQWITYKDDYNQAINTFYQQEQGTIWGLVAANAKMNVIKDKARDLYQLRISTDLSRAP